MTLLERLPGRGELSVAGVGVLVTFLAMSGIQRDGPRTTFALMFGVTAFVAVAAGFILVPHVLVALTVVYFALLPTLKTFVTPLLGGTKDLVSAAAIVATGILFVRRRSMPSIRRLDSSLLAIVGLVLGLYLVNIGGALSGETGHDIAWFHGVRLFAEPLSLFVVGACLPKPHRTLRWGVAALIAVCAVNALLGLLQQVVGVQGLVGAGYDYGHQVREAYGQLRSFGTLDEPFSYAGLLLLGLGALLVWSRRSGWTTILVTIIAIGLLASFVRTAALIAIAVIAIAAARLGYGRYAVILLLAVLAASIATFVLASRETEKRSVRINPTTYLTLNGRTNIWKTTLEGPSDWAFGRGVGAAGTASERAGLTLTRTGTTSTNDGTVVDSSYFTVIADIGIIGLAVVLAFFGRVVAAARLAARSGDRSGWLVITLLTVALLDAVTRESFTGFPTAYISMILAGLAWGCWALDSRAPPVEPRSA